MRSYRTGLWLLLAGLVLLLAEWLSTAVINQLYETQVFADFPVLTYVKVKGFISLGINVVLVAGALVAAVESRGPRRWWFTGIAIELALDQLFVLSPWLLSLVHIDIGERFVWCFRASVGMHIAALASFALVAREDRGNRALSIVALVILVARVALYLLLQALMKEYRPVPVLSPVHDAVAFTSVIVSIGVALDLLGAFPGERDTDARVGTAARSVASTIAMTLMFVGMGFAAFAVWGTKRTSAVSISAPMMISGSLLFIAGAMALWSLKRRAIPLGRFALATVGAIGIGYATLYLSTKPARDADLEHHTLPGLEISLPEGRTDTRYEFVELGDITVMTNHSDLGLVTLMWSRKKPDLLGMTRYIGSGVSDFVESTADGARVDGVSWTMTNMTELQATWQCPGDDRWFLLTMDRYSPGTAELHRIASRVAHTIRCTLGENHNVPPFHIEAPPGFAQEWGATLDDEPILAMAGIDAVAASSVTTHAGPAPKGVIESEEHVVYEQVVGDERRIASFWHCYTLDIDVAIRGTVPASEPRDAVLRRVLDTHCPR